jgi:hypothetical protein
MFFCYKNHFDCHYLNFPPLFLTFYECVNIFFGRCKLFSDKKLNLKKIVCALPGFLTVHQLINLLLHTFMNWSPKICIYNILELNNNIKEAISVAVTILVVQVFSLKIFVFQPKKLITSIKKSMKKLYFLLWLLQ